MWQDAVISYETCPWSTLTILYWFHDFKNLQNLELPRIQAFEKSLVKACTGHAPFKILQSFHQFTAYYWYFYFKYDFPLGRMNVHKRKSKVLLGWMKFMLCSRYLTGGNAIIHEWGHTSWYILFMSACRSNPWPWSLWPLCISIFKVCRW